MPPPSRPRRSQGLLEGLVEAGVQIFGQKAALDALILAVREPAVLEAVARAIYDGKEPWDELADPARAVWRRRAHRGTQALFKVFQTGRVPAVAGSRVGTL